MKTTIRASAHAGLVCLIAVAISACSTPYQDMSLLGGVSATQIDSNTLRIAARGNAFTDKSQIEDYVMLKAADETLQHGYDLFQITNDEDASRHETLSIPETHYATGYGVTATGQPISVTTQYTTTHESSYFKPGEITIIRMFKGVKSADTSQNVFSAREVEIYLGPKIRGAQSAQTVTTPVLSAAAAPRDSAQPIAVPVAVEMKANTPPPTCTKEQQELARLARENGYHYSSACN